MESFCKTSLQLGKSWQHLPVLQKKMSKQRKSFLEKKIHARRQKFSSKNLIAIRQKRITDAKVIPFIVSTFSGNVTPKP